MRERLLLLSRKHSSPPNPRISGGSLLLFGGLPLHHGGSIPLNHGGSFSPHRLGLVTVHLHRRSRNAAATHHHRYTKTHSSIPPPLFPLTFARNHHYNPSDSRALLPHLSCIRLVPAKISSFTTATHPLLQPPPEPPPLVQSPTINVTEALATVDLPKDRPTPKPPWQICGLTSFAIWLSVKCDVFMFIVDLVVPCGLLIYAWMVLSVLCVVLLWSLVTSVGVALRVFVEITVHPLLFGIGSLQLGTIVTTTNFIILSISQVSFTQVLKLANIETSYSRNVLVEVKKMIRNWIGLKTDGSLAVARVWMNLVWLLGFCCRFVYQELLTIMKRKVKARILINLLFSCDRQATIMLVLVVGQFETCYSRFVPALVQKMIRIIG